MEHVKMLIETLFSKLEGTTVKDTVVGTSIVINDNVIVPLFEVSLGVAGGGFIGGGEVGGKDEKKDISGQCKGDGKGGGTGGGLKVSPIAILSVNGQGELEVYAIGSKKGWSDRLSELMPQIIEKIKPQDRKEDN